MVKPLSQIAFDFTSDAANPVAANESVSITSFKESAAKDESETAFFEKSQDKPDREKIKPVSTRGRRSLKEIALEADLIQVPDDEVLFQKQYYSIGEVAGWFRVNQSLLRYWESEFDILQPRKNRKGDRFFRPVDIKNLQLIYDLLRRRKITIEGARDYLKKNKKAQEKFSVIESLEKIRAFLNELKSNL
jgi:DNA-binding transcriptional MerR regulator